MNYNEFDLDSLDIDNIEQNILAILINDKSSLSNAVTRIKSIHFNSTISKTLYEYIVELYKNGDDVNYDVLYNHIYSTVSDKKFIENISTYLDDVCLKFNGYENINSFLKILLNYHTKKEINNLCNEILSSKTNIISAQRDFEKWSSKLTTIVNEQSHENLTTLQPYISKYLEVINNAKNNINQIVGTISGYPDIDNITNGWKPGDLIILAARPSIGKTALAINFILNAAKELKDDEAVVMFSLEMVTSQIIERMVSNMSGISSSRIQKGAFSNDEFYALQTCLKKLSSMNIYCSDSPSINLYEIINKLRELSKTKIIKLVVVDYLQLVSSGDKQLNRHLEVGKISRTLKTIANELQIPIIAVAQLSRKIEERKGDDKRPMLSDLRESGSIEQDADIVAFIDYERNQIDESKNDNKGPKTYKDKVFVEFYIAKNRNGATGSVSLMYERSKGIYTSAHIEKEK